MCKSLLTDLHSLHFWAVAILVGLYRWTAQLSHSQTVYLLLNQKSPLHTVISQSLIFHLFRNNLSASSTQRQINFLILWSYIWIWFGHNHTVWLWLHIVTSNKFNPKKYASRSRWNLHSAVIYDSTNLNQVVSKSDCQPMSRLVIADHYLTHLNAISWIVVLPLFLRCISGQLLKCFVETFNYKNTRTGHPDGQSSQGSGIFLWSILKISYT